MQNKGAVKSSAKKRFELIVLAQIFFFCVLSFSIDIYKQLFYNGLGDIMERQILHVDVNNAFLSWTAVEMLKQGSKTDIREIPSVIGGDENRRSGIVLAKSPKS